VLILDPVPTPPIVGRPWSKSCPPAAKIRNLSELENEIVNPRVIAALREASSLLSGHGVRHATIGALAVGVHGWPRATRDVDLLVAPEAFLKARDGSQTPRVPLVETIDGVGIDYLPIEVAGDFLLAAFDEALINEGVPIAQVEVVIVTKLLRLLTRDQADVVELMKSGLVDETKVRGYLGLHTPMLTPRFDRLCEQAKAELAR
jgi:hypothetical protein